MKEIDFLGYKVNVVDDADIAQAREDGELHHYVVSRVIDTDPKAGSPDLRRRRVRTLCEKCGEVCWLDPKSFDPLRGMKLLVICVHCELAENQRADG